MISLAEEKPAIEHGEKAWLYKIIPGMGWNMSFEHKLRGDYIRESTGKQNTGICFAGT